MTYYLSKNTNTTYDGILCNIQDLSIIVKLAVILKDLEDERKIV